MILVHYSAESQVHLYRYNQAMSDGCLQGKYKLTTYG